MKRVEAERIGAVHTHKYIYTKWKNKNMSRNQK